jgi:hypothetical protein
MEVHSMLTVHENAVLAENLDEKASNHAPASSASGEHLDSILAAVAKKKEGTGLEPDKWELSEAYWGEYDPCFWHLSLKNHQSAADNRSKHNERVAKKKAEAKLPPPSIPICGPPEPCHASFSHLRTTLLSDPTLLHVLWSLLTDHFGTCPYERGRHSECAVGRTIQLLTLGVHSFREAGGAAMKQWAERVAMYDGDEFGGEEEDPTEPTTIEMLHDLASQANSSATALSSADNKGFIAQDQSLCAGASWLRDFFCEQASRRAEQRAREEGFDDDI